MDAYNTPLRQALEKLLAENRVRMHMPGHKGRLPYPFGEAARYDFTEVEGADSLFEASGPLLELERRLAAAYNAGASLLSAGGSTLCIQTMLYLARRRGKKILAGRNLHRAAVSAMGLLGLEPVWIPCPTGWGDRYGIDGLSLPPDPQAVETLLGQHPDAAAVYITSPDYFGQMADIPAISELCRSRGCLLLVDNAHGAHLSRFRAAMHPMQLGADLCCDSLHKSLPVLTGGAALHMADPAFYPEAKYAASLFGSTSPSYLVMLSADMALEVIEGTDDSLLRLGGAVGAMKDTLAEKGYQTIRSFVCDPLKLTVGFAPLGYTGREFGDYLRRHGIEPEYVSGWVAVFMPSLATTPQELARLEQVLLQLPPRPALEPPWYSGKLPRQPMTLAEAMNRPHLPLPVEQSEGRVAARLVSRCPPGIPLAVPGEEINKETIFALKTSGESHIYVVK